MPLPHLPVATLVAGGLLAAGVAAAGALTASGALAEAPSSNSTPPSSSAPAPGASGPRGLAGRGGFGLPGVRMGGPVLHGEVVVPQSGGSGTQTLLVQEGKITKKSGNDITVKSSDGFTLVWTLNSSTTVRTGWRSGSVQDLAVSDTVSVTGTKSGSGGTAQFVGERPAGAASGNGSGPPGWRHGGPKGQNRQSTPRPSTSGAGYGNI